ncbi:MAG: hypothetical protein KKD94_03645 [Nanoarchaeota archaeon]|nr:hypothetical protein [Nanoarchaeota archaeon]MBU1988547.1 hypothetical protein [Nanoarchaeota archaeon]
MAVEIILGFVTLIIVAFQVWILLRQTQIAKSQNEMIKEQSDYLKRKESPIIEIQKFEYNKDNIGFFLYNSGETKAVGVALKTEVSIVNPEVKKESGQTLVSSRGDWDIKKQFNFEYKNKKYSLRSSIIEIFHDKSFYPELEVNHSRKFENKVSFGLYDKKEKFPTPSVNLPFKELHKALRDNGAIGCEIKISLVYKNLANNVVEEILIDKFYTIPLNLKPKFLSELTEKDKLVGGMKYIPIHPFKKQEFNISKSEETYRNINHCER